MRSFFNREKILLRLHRHPIILIFQVLPFLLLLGIPAAYTYYTPQIEEEFAFLVPLLVYGNLVRDLFTLILFLFILYTFYIHYLDIWLVTEEHIVNMEQKTLFSKTIAEQELERIQDISAEVRGFFPTLFNYGDVLVQTAGTHERFLFKDVSHPHHIVTTISKLLQEKGYTQKNP